MRSCLKDSDAEEQTAYCGRPVS